MKRPKFIVAKIGKHGKGGNLPELHTTLFCDMTWTPAGNLQAENRTDRPQQKNPMTIRYYLTEGNDVVDAHVRRINQDKNRKIDTFMQPLTPEEVESMPAQVEALIEKYHKHFAVLGYPQPPLAPVHE